MTIPALITEMYIAPQASAPMVAVDRVEAVAGQGLVGDRYFLGNGFYSGHPSWGHNVTLIQSEAIAAINHGHQTNFTGAQLRRNLITANVKLDSLLGREFRCGTAILRGTKDFPPCMHLAQLIGDRQILRFLAYCGGIGAEVVVSGIIGREDSLELLE